MSAQLVDDDEAVLNAIKGDGTFDDLRRQALDKLKSDPELLQFVEESVRQNDVLNKRAREGADEKQLCETMRRDTKLEGMVSQKALQKLWNILHDERSEVAEAITQSVHQRLCAVYEERETGSSAVP